MSDESGSILSRWSQRKHAARVASRGGAAPVALKDADAPVVSDLQPQPAPDVPAQRSSDIAATTAERRDVETTAEPRPQLTPIEELTAESDYTQFLAEHVPEALQRAALRKLWTSDPVLACLDGLNDYEEDFNVIDTAISVTDTNYKIGRGFLEPDEPESEDTSTRVAVTGEAERTGVPNDQAVESEASPHAALREEEEDSQDSIAENGPRRLAADTAEEAPLNSSPDSLPRSKG